MESNFSPFESLPREMRDMINRNLVLLPGGLLLITPGSDDANHENRSEVILCIDGSKDAAAPSEVFAAYRALRGVNMQFAKEAVEDFLLYNTDTVHIDVVVGFESKPPGLSAEFCCYFKYVTFATILHDNMSALELEHLSSGVILKTEKSKIGPTRVIQGSEALPNHNSEAETNENIRKRVGKPMTSEEVSRIVQSLRQDLKGVLEIDAMLEE